MNPTLPIELLSEPYTTRTSCNLAEIIIPRARFLFEITTNYVSVTIGSCIVSLLYHPDPIEPSSLPCKCTSNVSLLTVYDTYGIVIAREFLHYLYYVMKHGTGSWLDSYLYGCARVLDTKSTYSDLRRALDALDIANNMPTVTITYMPLPVEIVAKIVNSYRISNHLSSYVRSQREQYIPILSQVDGWSTSNVAALSLSACKAFYISRGCNGNNGLRSILDHLSTSQLDIETVCSWVVGLQSELQLNSSSLQLSEDKMRELLARLIDMYKVRLLGN